MPLVSNITRAGAAAGAACATIWWTSDRVGLSLLSVEEDSTVVVDMTVLSSLAIGKACAVDAVEMGMVSSPLLRGIAEASLFAVAAGQNKAMKNAKGVTTANGDIVGNTSGIACLSVAA